MHSSCPKKTPFWRRAKHGNGQRQEGPSRAAAFRLTPQRRQKQRPVGQRGQRRHPAPDEAARRYWWREGRKIRAGRRKHRAEFRYRFRNGGKSSTHESTARQEDHRPSTVMASILGSDTRRSSEDPISLSSAAGIFSSPRNIRTASLRVGPGIGRTPDRGNGCPAGRH